MGGERRPDASMGRHTRRNEGATDMGEIRYMKVSREFYEGLNALPEAQARKMLYACVGYFFTGECDLTGNLRKLFDFSQRANLDRYRTSVLNGMKNAAKAGHGEPTSGDFFAKTDGVSGKTSQKLSRTSLGISPKVDVHHPTSPADTRNPGTTQTPTDGSGLIDKETNSNNKSESESESAAHTPSLEEVREYAEEQGMRIDPERFHDYYEAVGWKRNGSPVTDWKALERNWARSEGASRAWNGKPAEEPDMSDCPF
jgi:hypothetical protein